MLQHWQPMQNILLHVEFHSHPILHMVFFFSFCPFTQRKTTADFLAQYQYIVKRSVMRRWKTVALRHCLVSSLKP